MSAKQKAVETYKKSEQDKINRFKKVLSDKFPNASYSDGELCAYYDDICIKLELNEQGREVIKISGFPRWPVDSEVDIGRFIICQTEKEKAREERENKIKIESSSSETKQNYFHFLLGMFK